VKYCTQCGAASTDGARFCGKCGSQQKGVVAARDEVESVAVPPPTVTADQPETVDDLVFACPDCAKAFAIDAREAGRSCKCTDCHAAISIPEPVVRFSCPKCRHALGAPKEMFGIEMQCPECQSDIVVPTVASAPKAPVASFQQDADGEVSPPPQQQRARARLELPGLEGRPVRVELPSVTEGRRFLTVGADGEVYGPVTPEELRQWIREGRVHAGTQTQVEGASNWISLGAQLDFVDLFGGRSVPLIPPPIGVAPVPEGERVDESPVAVTLLLSVLTLGLFGHLWFNRLHGKFAKIRPNDPSAVKAQGFLFIPFFNLYWIFFTYSRLCTRLDEQRARYGLPPSRARGLAMAACIATVSLPVWGPIWDHVGDLVLYHVGAFVTNGSSLISYLAMMVCLPIFRIAGSMLTPYVLIWSVFFCKLQSSVNQLARANAGIQ
jgi:hypothetical protein